MRMDGMNNLVGVNLTHSRQNSRIQSPFARKN